MPKLRMIAARRQLLSTHKSVATFLPFLLFADMGIPVRRRNFTHKTTAFGSVLLIVVFLMPGFIASKVFSLVYPQSEASEARTVLSAITFSCFNHALLSPLYLIAWQEKWYENLLLVVVVTFCALFVVPALIAFLTAKFSESSWGRSVRDHLGLMHPIPKAWDYFFGQRRGCWVVATLKNGRTCAGFYGRNSFASSYPADEDLYLERLCSLTPEGKMAEIAPHTRGAIIRSENIVTLEFYES
jgi:hypothetical protein